MPIYIYIYTLDFFIYDFLKYNTLNNKQNIFFTFKNNIILDFNH